MSDNVLIAIIAASAIVISAITVLGSAIFAYIASNKRFDKLDTTLAVIQGDLKEFFAQIAKVKAHIKLD
jgi:hypothetical protein